MTPTALMRREPFGGLLFSRQDAVHIELDHEAFSMVRARLCGGATGSSVGDDPVLAEIATQLGGLPKTTVDVDYAGDVAPRPFAIYNAPTLADFQITTVCPLQCPHCYAASDPAGTSVPLADVDLVFADLARNGVTQVALGGGEPLAHPDFIGILELAAHYGMVPNLTTNGLFLDHDRLDAIARFCGAAALSLEDVGDGFARTRRTGFGFFQEKLCELRSHQIPTVLQVTLSAESFDRLGTIVDFCLATPGLYGVIFLSYKAVGRGQSFHHPLTVLPPARVHEELARAFMRLRGHTRVGYDCCLTPAMVGLEAMLEFSPRDHLEGCSAMRSSLGISPSLDVLPCTFAPHFQIGSLRHERLYDIWRSTAAEQFRDRMQLKSGGECTTCATRRDCLGGCPLFDLVRCIGVPRPSSASPAAGPTLPRMA